MGKTVEIHFSKSQRSKIRPMFKDMKRNDRSLDGSKYHESPNGAFITTDKSNLDKLKKAFDSKGVSYNIMGESSNSLRLNEKAKSEIQQQAAGAALAAKRGEIPVSKLQGASLRMYQDMTEDELEDFAGTKHDAVPEKVSERLNVGSIVKVKGTGTSFDGERGVITSMDKRGKMISVNFNPDGKPDINWFSKNDLIEEGNNITERTYGPTRMQVQKAFRSEDGTVRARIKKVEKALGVRNVKVDNKGEVISFELNEMRNIRNRYSYIIGESDKFPTNEDCNEYGGTNMNKNTVNEFFGRKKFDKETLIKRLDRAKKHAWSNMKKIDDPPTAKRLMRKADEFLKSGHLRRADDAIERLESMTTNMAAIRGEGIVMNKKLLEETNRMRKLIGLGPLNEADDYDEFFKQAADKFGIDPDAVDELPDDKKKEFFDYIDANWNSDSEFGDDGEVEEEGCDYKDKK